MNLNYPHYIFQTDSNLIVLKFPEEKGRVLFALRTNLDKLHFWLATSKAGTVVEVGAGVIEKFDLRYIWQLSPHRLLQFWKEGVKYEQT